MCLQGSSVLTKAMGNVMETLTNTTYPKYKTYGNSQSAESVLLFVCSVLRSVSVGRNLSVALLSSSALAILGFPETWKVRKC